MKTHMALVLNSEISHGKRIHHGSVLQSLVYASLMIISPVVVIFYWTSLSKFQGSLGDTLGVFLQLGPLEFLSRFYPRPDWLAAKVYVGWLLWQAFLYRFMPGVLNYGQPTPSGYALDYYTNGLLSWFITHKLYTSALSLVIFDSTFIPQNWEGLLFAANITGFLITFFAYAKAHLAPSYHSDRKFNENFFHDLYSGIELNPRIGQYFDLKLFTNGRPGIAAWTLIDFTFLYYQFKLHGFISNSMLVVCFLHLIYVLDFFYHEDLYLNNIDISHDHYGFYLAWGSFVWLPTMYTLQAQFLAYNPINLPKELAIFWLCTGLFGYYLFRSVNNQKDLVRLTEGECLIWGKKPDLLRVTYQTKDGIEYENILLCSGWWGIARHLNYLGDLILSFSMCAACGFSHLLPWTYVIYMTVLLIHRSWRDDERLRLKYGKGWEEYCKRVKWVICPGIY